jgi:uncharacterized membrane protein YccC
MMVRQSLSRKAGALAERLGLSHDDLLGFRFAVNVLIASSIVWYTLLELHDTSPIWAIASLVAASDPEPRQARQLFRSRIVNVLVGCIVGFVFIFVGSSSQRVVPVALAVTVLISTYLVRVKTMWRQAPITAAIVIAASLSSASTKVGLERGLHRVAEVLFGSLVGMLVSWTMSKVWLVRQPPDQTVDA